MEAAVTAAHIVFLFVTVIWYPSGPATTVQPMKTQAACLELKKYWDFDQSQDNAVNPPWNALPFTSGCFRAWGGAKDKA